MFLSTEKGSSQLVYFMYCRNELMSPGGRAVAKGCAGHSLCKQRSTFLWSGIETTADDAN